MKLRTDTQQFLLFRSFTSIRVLHGELRDLRARLTKEKSYSIAAQIQKVQKQIEQKARVHRDVWVVIDTRTNEATLRGQPLRPTGTLPIVRK